MSLEAKSTTRPLRTALTVHWILRVSVFLCFVGHGAFGIKQKVEWLAFMRPFGFSDNTALTLMPLIGCFDIAFGCLALIRPTRVLLIANVAWGLFTACLRPLIGMSFFEVIERAGNYGPALALLAGTAGAAMLSQTKPHNFEIFELRTRVRAILIGATFLLLLGHGGLAVMGKPMLIQHWASIGLGHNTPTLIRLLGVCEIAAAFAVLLRPGITLCLSIFLWKLFTESLFITAGAPFWEVVERGGSYGTPLALAIMLYWYKQHLTTLRPHWSLESFSSTNS